MEQGLGPYLIISATKPAISLPTSLRPCHMFTKAGMAWPWHEHNVMQLGMSFRICELLNTNHRLRQEEAGIKGNRVQCGASKFHKPLQQLLIRQWSKQLQQRHESIVSKAPQPGRRGPLAFQPFCSEFLAGAVPWMGNLVAWQSPGSAVFRPAPLMAQRLPFLSGFPWSPSPPVQQTAAWAGMPTTQEHSGLKCFGMVVTSARNYPAKEAPWSALGA